MTSLTHLTAVQFSCQTALIRPTSNENDIRESLSHSLFMILSVLRSTTRVHTTGVLLGCENIKTTMSPDSLCVF